MQLSHMFLIFIFSLFAELHIVDGKRLIINCKELQDGLYPADNTGCNPKYIECRQNMTDYHHCSMLSIYNPVAAKCVPRNKTEACKIIDGKTEIENNQLREEYLKEQSNYNQDSECEGESDIIITYLECGKIFLTCRNGKGTRDMCSGNLYYDTTQRKCDEEYKVKNCYERTFDSPPCGSLPFGYYGKRNERIFYQCSGPLLFFQLRCSEGYGFSPDISMCEKLENF